MNAQPPRPTWATCHAANMTAEQAAHTVGLGQHAAYCWASKNGKRWRRPFVRTVLVNARGVNTMEPRQVRVSVAREPWA